MNERTEMPLQNEKTRILNFDEVALGFSSENAIAEANRCLHCKNKPCVDGCPVGIDIPSFISFIKTGDNEKAYAVISENNLLACVTGRVCPQENQCEKLCVRGIKGEAVAIGALERFCADEAMKKEDKNEESQPISRLNAKIAIIGSGPSGLSCAGGLCKKGYKVTVFESLHEFGGVLIYGIPEFRLPKKIVAKQIDKLRSLGVEFVADAVIGKTLTLEQLKGMGFSAAFIGSGAGLPKFMGIEGENLVGVYSANEYLTRVNLMHAYREGAHTPVFGGGKVAVIGGGNVAMDAARCAVRMGCSVTVIYRRTQKELPARREETLHAISEGVKFLFLTNPTAILGENGKVKAVKVIKMELGEPDASGRARPVEIPDSEYEIAVDGVIMALGTSPNPMLSKSSPSLKTDRHGCIVTDEKGMTSISGVFAGGDAVTGAATVILAMGAGKQAAENINEYLKTAEENL